MAKKKYCTVYRLVNDTYLFLWFKFQVSEEGNYAFNSWGIGPCVTCKVSFPKYLILCCHGLETGLSGLFNVSLMKNLEAIECDKFFSCEFFFLLAAEPCQVTEANLQVLSLSPKKKKTQKKTQLLWQIKPTSQCRLNRQEGCSESSMDYKRSFTKYTAAHLHLEMRP